ncbi:MAG: 2-succinyl-5-enolpyruvyl-6-hydroxy-3-cyclohexene-1-carboxylic-acid synthase [Gemmatimonadetes bacterium]|nr:2-succinyl-5-enolpyruvyl-6-hydroxy-3-cyclohexene-1-carboxylic-acid synthase [Gemmatimonadota bacterium]
MSASATTAWARSIVDELARCGVRDVVLAPGSRSTPLVLAFAADGRFRLRVHLDERSAAFFALGVGKASRRPAAVVTTSGTAAANLFPAVVEAAMAEVPLLLLTADRPSRLRDADANQAIDQVRLYGAYPRAFFDLATPVLEAPALRHLRAVTCRAVAVATGAPAGPVHLNVPFDKPLEPVENDEDLAAFAADHPLAASGHPGGEPFVRVRTAPARAGDDEITELATLLAESPRTLIVAGPTPEPAAVGAAVRTLAEAVDCPVLADPLSGARYGDPGGACVVGAYDLYLRDAAVRSELEPTLVVRVGTSPTSAALQEYLLGHGGPRQVVVDAGWRWKDHGTTAIGYMRADPVDTMRRLAEEVRQTAGIGLGSSSGVAAGDTGDRSAARAAWRELWSRAEDAARAAVSDSAAGEPHEGNILAAVAAVVPEGGTLFVSSSMPVRDLDAYGAPRATHLRVVANRGASGIDGIVSSAFGVASTTGEPIACVLGDVAFFHDQNGLLWAREQDARVVFVLIDNDGGGIFHMLPVREHEPHFTPLFATPHGLDLRHAAEMHGLAVEDVAVGDVGSALARALADGTTRILRVRTGRAANQSRHAEVAAAVLSRVREALR